MCYLLLLIFIKNFLLDMGKNCKSKKDKSSRKEQLKLEKRLKRIESKANEPIIEEMLEAFHKERNSIKQISVKISDPPSLR